MSPSPSKKRKRKDKVRAAVRVSPRKKLNLNDPCTSFEESQSATPPAKKLDTTAVKGCASDGGSFEVILDDELPDITLSSPSKYKKFSKDDIIWAPWEQIYWPAVVTSVAGRKVRFLFINEPRTHVESRNAKRLLPFDCSSTNSELKERGESAYPLDFPAAYELVIKYLCKKKNDPELDAKRFLITSDHNDEVGRAKDCLFRLTGRLGSDVSDTHNLDKEEEVMEMSDDSCHEQEEEKETVKNNILSRHSQEEKSKVMEILKDLESVPEYMTVKAEELEGLREEAKDFLKIIDSKDCFEHLLKIREGSIPSSRHRKFIKEELVRGGLGPFTLFKDLTAELLIILDGHCADEDDPSYKYNVMLPEAIIYAIAQRKGLEKLAAKKYFNLMCKKVGVRD